MRLVGVDPGKVGAAVVVGTDGLTVTDRVRWRGAATPPPELVAFLRPGDLVALEEQYVGKGARASLALATWCGRLLELMPAGVTPLRPLATTWRAKVLRAGRLRRDVAKRLAIAAARNHLPDCTADEAEAWCLARYAWGWAAAHPDELAALAAQPPEARP